MSKTKLCVMFGGRSSEHNISCISAEAVLNNCDKEKYEIFPVGITKDGVWWLYKGDFSRIGNGEWERDSENLVPAVLSPCSVHKGLVVFNKPEKKYDILPLDCIIPVMHGENGEDGRLQGLMEASGVAYVGCKTCSSALTMDKAFTKTVLDLHGIPQARWYSFTAADFFGNEGEWTEKLSGLGYPMYVKPANAGSSLGISKVKAPEGLREAVELAARIDNKIVAEENICGMEIEVALLEERDGVKATCCGQICSEADFYSYESKYVSPQSFCVIPAPLSEDVSDKVIATAKRVFSLLDCRGLSRADFFVKDSGEVIFNEINTFPGFTSISMYPKLWEYCGIGFKELVDRLVGFATEEDKA